MNAAQSDAKAIAWLPALGLAWLVAEGVLVTSWAGINWVRGHGDGDATLAELVALVAVVSALPVAAALATCSLPILLAVRHLSQRGLTMIGAGFLSGILATFGLFAVGTFLFARPDGVSMLSNLAHNAQSPLAYTPLLGLTAGGAVLGRELAKRQHRLV